LSPTNSTASNGGSQLLPRPSSDGYPLSPSVVVITTSIRQQNSSLVTPQGPSIGTITRPYPPFSNGTQWIGTGNQKTRHDQCTGCAIAAAKPVTTSYVEHAQGNWSSIVVTETVLTEFVTYLINNATIDTVVTEERTLNQTKTVIDDMNQTITRSTPVFVIEPAPGTFLTVDAGPTYLIYTGLFGGLETPRNSSYNSFQPTQPACKPQVTSLKNWEPTRTEHWNYFIQTITGNASIPTATDGAVPLPSDLVDFLKQDPNIQSQFRGSDIATCTRAGEQFLHEPFKSRPPPMQMPPPEDQTGPGTATKTVTKPAMIPPAFTTAFSFATGDRTWLSTWFSSTSQHVTKQGCLRCDTNPGVLPPSPTPQGPKVHDPAPVPDPVPTPNSNRPDPNSGRPNSNPNPPNSLNNSPNNNPLNNNNSNNNTPNNNPPNNNPPNNNPPNNNPPNNNPPNNNSPNNNSPGNNSPGNNPPNKPAGQPNSGGKPTPSVPDVIKSIIHDNPNLTQRPQQPPQQKPTGSEQTVKIGDNVFNVHLAEPTQNQNDKPDQQNTDGKPNQPNDNGKSEPQTPNGGPHQENKAPPVVVVGSETLTAGETKTINGVAIVVPTDDGGSKIIVGGSTININPAPTAAPIPVITVGHELVTANSEGRFVVGTETLTPGGSAILVDGNTLSLDPSGAIAIVNGVTQTVAHGQNPTGAPVLTISGQAVSATMIGGSTVLVLDHDQTLAPGRAVTIAGTTYSMPVDGRGSVVIVNGQTRTLEAGMAMPFNTQLVSTTVADGTTAFVFGPSQTLTLGGVITISGTTIFMPAYGSGSVVVINGVSSTFGQILATSAAPLTINGKTITATVRDGTTEYVVNGATTLKTDGEMVISGTTYSLDPSGTVLVINGKTSTIATTPATNTARTTSTSATSESSSSIFIASGAGETSKGAGVSTSRKGFDSWVESLVIGTVGWILMFL
jgi:hypothetical protein